MLSATDVSCGLLARSPVASADASAGFSTGAASVALSSSAPPVSNAANPGMVQASAAACAVAPTPTGGEPAAKASSMTFTRSAFLYFDRAEGRAGEYVSHFGDLCGGCHELNLVTQPRLIHLSGAVPLVMRAPTRILVSRTTRPRRAHLLVDQIEHVMLVILGVALFDLVDGVSQKLSDHRQGLPK